jgi:hypothetical protein
MTGFRTIIRGDKNRLVLKDIQCECGARCEADVPMIAETVYRKCYVCEHMSWHTVLWTTHKITTWGWKGVNLADFIFYDGIRAGKPTNPGARDESTDMAPAVDEQGKPYHERDKYSADAREEKRKERRAAAHRRKYGKKIQIETPNVGAKTTE